MQGMVTAAMNGSAMETKGCSRPAMCRWNGGFAGASRDPDAASRIVSSVDRSDREMPDASYARMGAVEPARIAAMPKSDVACEAQSGRPYSVPMHLPETCWKT
jgi:hypothetical protein